MPFRSDGRHFVRFVSSSFLVTKLISSCRRLYGLVTLQASARLVKCIMFSISYELDQTYFYFVNYPKDGFDKKALVSSVPFQWYLATHVSLRFPQSGMCFKCVHSAELTQGSCRILDTLHVVLS